MSNTTETQPTEPGGPYYPAVTEEEDLASSLRSLMLLVRRRIKTILLIVLLGTGLAGFVAFSREPTYTAQALVMLKPQENKILDLEEVAASLNNGAISDSGTTTMVETQVKLLTSPVYLTRLVERMPELGKGAGLTERLVAGPLATLVAMVPEDWLIASGLADERAATKRLAAADDGGNDAVAQQDRQEASIAKSLSVTQQGRSLVLAIGYSAKDPAQAAQVANTLADFYIQDQLGEKLDATKLATNWIEVRLADLRQELQDSEQAVEKYRNQHQLFENSGVQMNSQQVSDLTNMLVTTRANRSEKETRLRYIRDLQSKGEDLSSVTEVLESPYLSSLWVQKTQLQQQEAELLADYGDKHPKVQYMEAQKKDIADKIDKEIKRLVDNIANEVSVLAARERSIQTDINGLLTKTGSTNQAQVELHQLDRQAEANRKLYEEFLARAKETKEQQGIVQANAKIIAHAKPPTKPSSIPSPLILLAGFLGSSMLGLGLAWMTERLDNGLRSGKQIEAAFGLPCLGLIPVLHKAGKGAGSRPHRYLLKKPLSTYAEAVRTVHTALRLSNVDRPPRVIQVTSAVPGEGKTVFATSLATLLAQNGHRTLLLDLDLRHPSVSREIAITREAALTDYVLGELDLADLAERDEESGLDVIAVRRPPQNPAAILGSQRLRDLMQRLRGAYEYIIVDSTPVLGVSDSKVTAELVDAILFVVRWEQTTFDTAADAIKELAELKLALAGVVLTQVDVVRHARYGYGGIDNYYHKYRKYYQN